MTDEVERNFALDAKINQNVYEIYVRSNQIESIWIEITTFSTTNRQRQRQWRIRMHEKALVRPNEQRTKCKRTKKKNMQNVVNVTTNARQTTSGERKKYMFYFKICLRSINMPGSDFFLSSFRSFFSCLCSSSDQTNKMTERKSWRRRRFRSTSEFFGRSKGVWCARRSRQVFRLTDFLVFSFQTCKSSHDAFWTSTEKELLLLFDEMGELNHHSHRDK